MVINRICSACLILFLCPPLSAESPRKTVRFDSNWAFALGDPPSAQSPDFDDSMWRKLDVPHDWSIEGAFDRDALARGAGAFLPTGIGWYRKHFTLPESDSARRAFIEFDGVMANSDGYVNGTLLWHGHDGYVSF